MTSVDVISTGSLRLDIALGAGGMPRGGFVEITGPESSGKTTLCQHLLGEAQKMGELCAFIDADHTFNPSYARQCGVDLDRLVLCDPPSLEQALATLELLALSGSLAVVVVDSLNALVPEDELKAPLGAELAAQSDTLLSMTLRRLSSPIHQSKTTILFTHQAEKGLSAVYHGLASNLSRLGLKLHAGVRIELQPEGVIKYEGQVIGDRVKVRVLRNRFAPYIPTLKLDIVYNHGINKVGEIFQLSVESGLITQQGLAYFYRSQELGTGRQEAFRFLNQNAPVCEAIEQTLRQQLLKTVRSSPVEIDPANQ